MRIGILGGTFDPPHLGHIQLAEAALTKLQLDEVLFIPANRNPLKSRRASRPKDRLEMVRLAIEGHPGFAVSDIEIARGGPSYAIDTLSELQAARPGDYWLILGTDALKGFMDWKSPERILQKARLAVAIRPPQKKEDVLAQTPEAIVASVDWLEMPPTDISSTDIRLRIEERRPSSHLLDPRVMSYIEENSLYR